jgi:hypothetical protein
LATVLSVGGFTFAIYPNDHGLPHVHVYDADGTARIALGDETIRPEIISLAGMNDVVARRARRFVEMHQQLLSRAWRRMHDV